MKERGNCTLIEIIHTAEAHFITGLVSGEKAQNRALVYFCHAMLRLYSRRRSMVMDVRVNVTDLWLLRHWHRRGQSVSEICSLVGCDGMVRNIQPVSRYFLQLCVLGVCFLGCLVDNCAGRWSFDAARILKGVWNESDCRFSFAEVVRN